MKITLTSILVDDQAKALAFYTDVLGFEKKTDIPLGEHRWLTVVSPAAPDGVQLVLEPDEHPAAKQFSGWDQSKPHGHWRRTGEHTPADGWTAGCARNRQRQVRDRDVADSRLTPARPRRR